MWCISKCHELMRDSHADIPDENAKRPKDGLPLGPEDYLD
jgi:hypothetical protein